MNRDERDDELNQSGARELLANEPLLRLAYLGTDGLPRVIPIGFYWNGEAVIVCTAVSSPKVKALGLRPDVAITIDAGSTPATAKALLLRGAASLETVDGVPDEFILSSTKTFDEAQVAEYAAQAQATYAQMTRITIDVSWARFYDFGAGRLPGFLSDLVN